MLFDQQRVSNIVFNRIINNQLINDSKYGNYELKIQIQKIKSHLVRFLKCNDMIERKENVTLISIQLFIRLFVIRKTMRAKSVESLCL